MMKEKISIIGGGIGGLTTALALEQKGIPVEVFEQAPMLKTVGAGIILANNAMQVFDHLGLSDELNALGNKISVLKVTDPQLSTLSTIRLQDFEHRYGVNNIAIHRADLQRLLFDRLQQTPIHLGQKLKGVEVEDDCVKLFFDQGETVETSALVGADGIHSIVRSVIDPGIGVRQARQICWRGVLDTRLPDHLLHEFNEAWGKGCRMGFGQINERQVYWFALGNFTISPDEYAAVDWRQLFSNFHPLIQQLLADTPDSAIHTDEITDLQFMPDWYKDRVCLIGDAAHATTPNMGQGAGQAIEDAWALSQCLEQASVRDAFRTFQASRFKKVRKVVDTSWRIGQIAQLESRLLIGLRNWVMRLIPDAINRRQLKEVFELVKIEH